MSEVDDAHDSEDEREPDGDQGVDAAEQDRRDNQLGDVVQGRRARYFRWSHPPSGIHLARFVVNSSGHTVTSCPFCHCSM